MIVYDCVAILDAGEDMPTQSHANQRYGHVAGIRLMTELEAIGADPFTTTQATQLAANAEVSPSSVPALLHDLTKAEWITRIKKGLYAINDPVTRAPKAHPYAISTAIVTPSALSHWSALQHWGLVEQIPLGVIASSPVRTFPPVMDGDTRQSRAAWVVNGIRYEFVTIARCRFFGTQYVWVSERNRIPIFDLERALIDGFHHFHIFGSFSTALAIVEAHLHELDLQRLVDYAVRINIASVARRVGWTLDRLGVSTSTLDPLRTIPAKGDVPLDPGRPARGRHDAEWHVIENLGDGR